MGIRDSAKAIYIDFGTAERFGGICNLRMDDTNPVKEDVEYVDAIKEDIHWLGYDLSLIHISTAARAAASRRATSLVPWAQRSPGRRLGQAAHRESGPAQRVKSSPASKAARVRSIWAVKAWS